MRMIVTDENGRDVEVWTTDNFTPGNYLPLNGGTLTGVLKIKSKLFVSELSGFQDGTPAISLAIGDSDTGFHSEGDGQIAFYSNNVRRYNMLNLWGTHNFDPNSKLNVSGGTLSGNLTVTGSFDSASASISGTLSAKKISVADEIDFSKNTDYFKIGFKNTADSDTDSYGYIKVGDNGNEYFKIISVSGSTETEWFSVKNDALRFKNQVLWHTGNFNPSNYASSGHNHDSVYAKIHSHPYLSTSGGTVSGNLTVTGTVYGNSTANFQDVHLRSDVNSKCDVVGITNCLEKIKKLNGYTYKYKNSGVESAGLIAQEVLEVLPDIVSVSEDGMLNMQYAGIIALLVEAVKELSHKIEVMENV